MRSSIEIFNYSVFNKDEGKSLDVHIDGDIVDAPTQELMKSWFGDETSVSFRSLRNQIEDSKAKIVNIYVNSPGGHVGDAMAIHDYLSELESKGTIINRRGRGIVASAATYIVMGKNSELSKNSFFLIHNTRGAIAGDVNEVENYAKTMRKFNNRIRDFYSEETSKPKETISAWMNDEELMTAEVAKERGFVKDITGDVQLNPIVENKWELNSNILNTYNLNIKQKDMPENKMLDAIKNGFEDLKNFFKDNSKPTQEQSDDVFGKFASAIENAIKENPSVTLSTIQEIVNSILESKKYLTEDTISDVLRKKDIENLVTSDSLTSGLESLKNTLITEFSKKLGNVSSTPGDDDEVIVTNNKKSNGKYSEYSKNSKYWQAVEKV